MSKIVVITGCQGFIAQYVVEACIKRGWKVYGIDKMTYASAPLKAWYRNNDNFKFIQADIAELDRLPDCDYVINMAAESHVGNSIVNSQPFYHSNVEGVRNLLELIRNKPDNAYGKPLFLHFSTDEVYGDITEEEGSFKETAELCPNNPYSASKAAADLMIKAWHRTYGLEHIIVRPTNNYGIGQYPEKLIPLCVKLLQAEKPIKLHNHGDPVRSWLHAHDTAEAVLWLLGAYELDKKGTLEEHLEFPDSYCSVVNSIFNIGGVEKQNKEVVEKVINAYDPTYEWMACVDLSFERPGQDVRYSVDDSKLRSLGWKPKADFDEELKKIVRHCKVRFRW